MDAATRLALRAHRADPTPETADVLLVALERAGKLDDEGAQPAGTALRLTRFGANVTEVTLGSGRALVSYDTVVAFRPWGAPVVYRNTDSRDSRTTSKHLNAWPPYSTAATVQGVTQAEIDAATAGEAMPIRMAIEERWRAVAAELGQLAGPSDGPAPRSTRLAAWELASAVVAEIDGRDPAPDLRNAAARLPSACTAKPRTPKPKKVSPDAVTAEDMTTNTRTGPMPAHLAEYSETEETWDRCDASWSRDFEDRTAARGLTIRGCPLGRGTTVEAAMHDLIRRTNAESGLSLTWKGK